jgi:hypothetical protein
MTIINPALPTVLYTVPYLTVDEYRRAPTGVDLVGLSPGTGAQRDAELANIIARASGLVNTVAFQNLAATSDTEQTRARMNRAGEITVQTRNWPIQDVQSVFFGPQPNELAQMDLTNLWIEDSSFTLAPPSLGLTSSQGALQFPMVGPSARGFAKYTYTNGWPCTTLANAPAQGATSIQVADKTGIHANTKLTIYDAANTETVTVTVEPVSTTLTVSATQFAHTNTGVSVTSLPPAIKEAAILMVSALIKLRGNQALIMRQINGSAEKDNKNEPGHADVRDAVWILQPFRAVR